MLLRFYTSSTQPGSYSYFPIVVIYFYFRAYFTNHKNAKLSNLSILVCDGGKKIYQPHIKSRWLTNPRPGVEGCSALHSCNWWEAKKIATIQRSDDLNRNRASNFQNAGDGRRQGFCICERLSGRRSELTRITLPNVEMHCLIFTVQAALFWLIAVYCFSTDCTVFKWLLACLYQRLFYKDSVT